MKKICQMKWIEYPTKEACKHCIHLKKCELAWSIGSDLAKRISEFWGEENPV